MAHYYLAAYVGSGAEDDPYRPSGGDLDGEWSSIDFRPPGAPEGRAVLVVPDALPTSPQRLHLGDDLDGLTAAARRAVENRMGVDLSAAGSIRELIADLLIRHGNDRRKDRWNQLKAERGAWHRIYLGGLIYEVPVLKALSLSDSMTRADNTDINVGAPVTWGQDNATFQINSNIAKNAAVAVGAVRAESDLASANQYAQGTLYLAITVNGVMGPCCRFNSANYERYESTVQQNGQAYRIAKRSTTNVLTTLVTKTSSVLAPSGNVLRLEVNGSSLTSYLAPAAGNDTQSVTDTSITGNLRTGWFGGASGGGVNRQGISLWSAGDLGPATVNAVLASALGSLMGSLTAVPTVAATLASPLGGLTSTATAVPSHPAALTAALGGLSTTATAVVTEPATLSAPLGSLTATAAATPAVNASLAASLGGLTGAVAATVTHSSVLTASLGGLAATVTATPTVAAVLAAPLGGLTATITATPVHTAVLAAPLGVLAANADATATTPSGDIDAALDAQLGALIGTAAATVTEPAVLSAPLGGLAATASATATEPAVFSAPLGALNAAATATPTVEATLHVGLGAIVAAAQAIVTDHATLTAPLGGLHAQASAVVVKAAVLQAVLGSLTAHANATAVTPGPVLPFPVIEREYALNTTGTYALDGSREYRLNNSRTY